MTMFQLYGGSANDEVAAFGNGFTLAVVIYATAHISGGHVNPAVSFATCLTGWPGSCRTRRPHFRAWKSEDSDLTPGHMSWGRGLLYATAQVLGGILGALIEVRLQSSAVVWGTVPL